MTEELDASVDKVIHKYCIRVINIYLISDFFKQEVDSSNMSKLMK
jgi:hypothetical protein